MKFLRLFAVSLLLLPLLVVNPLYAQVDIAGTWEAQLPASEGDESPEVAFEFQARDGDVTGAMVVGDDTRLPLEEVDVRVRGDLTWITFRLTTEQDRRVYTVFSGVVQGDRIPFHAMHVFMPVQQPPDYPYTRLSPVTRQMDFTAVRVR